MKQLYISDSKTFKISRSKIDLFIDCPQCFYLDRKLGVSRPSGPPFTLNSAVDHLLKKEFDIHRAKNKAHPLMSEYKIKAVPFSHKNLNDWRNNFKGIQYHHPESNFLIFGAIDDVWINDSKELHIVDYKATSKAGEVELTDAKYHDAYRRQMEIYQWLFRKNDFKVSNTGYFVYANGQKDREAFDAKLEFDVKIIPYQGKDDWIESVIMKIKKCLDSDSIPPSSEICEFCFYRKSVEAAF